MSTDCLTYVDTAISIDSIPTTATRVLEEIINKKIIPNTSFDSQKTHDYCVSRSITGRSSFSMQTSTTPPILKSPNSKIQKQISMYERDSGSMTRPEQTSNHNESSPSTRRNAEFYRFLSVDQRSISDTEDNVSFGHDEWKQRSNRTKSCANLKISCTMGAHKSAPHSPGAVLVKEKYIDVPKRIACNFHGKTDVETTNDGCVLNGQPKTKPRFIKTRVNESVLNDNNNLSKEN